MEGDDRSKLKIVLLCIIMILVGSIATKVLDTYRADNRKYVSEHGWDKLKLVLEQIDEHYVDDIDHKEVTEEILPKLLSSLDPHSLYLPPKNLEESDSQLEGNLEGIGITFNVPEDTAIVISVLSGGPAFRSGLNPGDKIITVDGDTLAGKKIPVDSISSRLKGVAGTEVTLGVLRGGENVVFDITRDKIPVKSIDVAYMLDDTTGYMKLSKFSRTSHKEFEKALEKLDKEGMKRLVFDLQDNTGGYLDQALFLCNEFLPKGSMIVYMEGKHRPRQEFKADGSGKCLDLELSVLINQNSASSSEIFAGAMQDNDRATIIGRRSYGKGVVQEPIYFSDNSGIRLTVARFYTATGRCIQKPYTGDEEKYAYDIYERYLHGEMTDADSIPKNDSLKFTTPKGKTVYGGGGITPDIFVPIDTAGVTDLLVKINRQALIVKYSSILADRYRKELREIKNMKELDILLDDMNLEGGFKAYLRSKGMKVPQDQWTLSESIILTQLRALVGRYSPLDDDAFYPILAELDNMIETAKKI